MSRLGPHYPEILAKCVEGGATEVVVIPYFLNNGLHIRLDIPEMMKEEAEEICPCENDFWKASRI